jgi:hypothetical protein
MHLLSEVNLALEELPKPIVKTELIRFFLKHTNTGGNVGRTDWNMCYQRVISRTCCLR